MGLFDEVKESVTVPEAAERYGLNVRRNGFTNCLFHPDRHPSMRLNEKYYYCFSCGAHGDVIDLVAKLLDVRPKAAAEQLAADFSVRVEQSFEYRRKTVPKTSPKEEERRCFRVLIDYLHRLEDWHEEFQPLTPEEEVDPRFTEALVNQEYISYLIEKLIAASDGDRQKQICELEGMVNELEQRFHADQLHHS